MRNISYMLNSLNFFVFLVFSYKSGSDARSTNIFSPVTCEMFYFLFVCKSIVISGKKNSSFSLYLLSHSSHPFSPHEQLFYPTNGLKKKLLTTLLLFPIPHHNTHHIIIFSLLYYTSHYFFKI